MGMALASHRGMGMPAEGFDDLDARHQQWRRRTSPALCSVASPLAVAAFGIHTLVTAAGCEASVPSLAAVGPLLSDAASDDIDILSWIAQNAALETAWLAFIAASIVWVAMDDPKR